VRVIEQHMVTEPQAGRTHLVVCTGVYAAVFSGRDQLVGPGPSAQAAQAARAAADVLFSLAEDADAREFADRACGALSKPAFEDCAVDAVVYNACRREAWRVGRGWIRCRGQAIPPRADVIDDLLRMQQIACAAARAQSLNDDAAAAACQPLVDLCRALVNHPHQPNTATLCAQPVPDHLLEVLIMPPGDVVLCTGGYRDAAATLAQAERQVTAQMRARRPRAYVRVADHARGL
jgi:hypothetical protein